MIELEIDYESPTIKVRRVLVWPQEPGARVVVCYVMPAEDGAGWGTSQHTVDLDELPATEQQGIHFLTQSALHVQAGLVTGLYEAVREGRIGNRDATRRALHATPPGSVSVHPGR